MKNKVTKSRFLDWYFSDSDVLDSLGERAYQGLMYDDEFHITTRDLFNECGYIPAFICVDAAGDIEYDPSEVELING
jgi:hypothetical protein